jgi:hypothetical protein
MARYLMKLFCSGAILEAKVAVRQADLRAHSDDLNAIAITVCERLPHRRTAMLAKAAIVMVLLVGAAWSGLAAPMHAQTISIADQKPDGLAAAMRAVISQGLFAEEYDAILEAARDDPQLREKIIEYIMGAPK